jgi:hypothetical protein
MIHLERFTTEYVAVEDRICLLARGRGDEPTAQPVQRIWLTARLLRQLLPTLLEGLERPRPGRDARGQAIQQFAQQAARATQPVLPAVALPAAAEQAASWVACVVHMSRTPQMVHLTFKGPASEEALLALAPGLLRQWLNILHDQWSRAGWPGDVWPAWMKTGADAPAPAAGVPVH